MFWKHPKVFIENTDTHQIQQINLARCVAGGDVSDNDNNINDQNSVSYIECLDPDITEIMDVTEERVDTEIIDSKSLNVQGSIICIQTVT